MNEKKKKLPKEIADFLELYQAWYDRNKPGNVETTDSNPNDPPPPPPGPIKPTP